MENQWKSPFFFGKSTINGTFSIAMLVYRRVYSTTNISEMVVGSAGSSLSERGFLLSSLARCVLKEHLKPQLPLLKLPNQDGSDVMLDCLKCLPVYFTLVCDPCGRCFSYVIFWVISSPIISWEAISLWDWWDPMAMLQVPRAPACVYHEKGPCL